MYGFWLGQCIANWTGLITEMDRIGNIGEIKTGDFYTREDWGKPEQPNIWGEDKSETISRTIDFVLKTKDEIWGADDDTDIEFIYQTLLLDHNVNILSGKQIQQGWLKHIKKEEENYLWVSNQAAFNLMQEGTLPPETSDPENNQYFDMIDAQLTTEIFGLYAPGNPSFALKMASLPIRTTARKNAAWISEFYITMHSLASSVDSNLIQEQKINWMANEARKILPDTSYSAKMFDFVKLKYISGIPWEATRDSIYQRYQVEQKDGYKITSRNLHCNGCFAAGINYAASLISLFYGKGDLKETIKIGVLTGWDSDNPTATWGGLIGFMIGKEGIETVFGKNLSNKFNIHRTRQKFSNNGIFTFEEMAESSCTIVERVIVNSLNGQFIKSNNTWIVPVN
tara:strand:- start:1212 stop:2402 length:1191 start_codon:yes stop_codon:yes gene_type:complete